MLNIFLSKKTFFLKLTRFISSKHFRNVLSFESCVKLIEHYIKDM